MRSLLLSGSLLVAASLLAVGVMELVARAAWKARYNQQLATQLHGFDRVDPERGITVPIPGTRLLVGDHRENLERHGKRIGLEVFDEMMRREGLSRDAVLFQVNELGFKGPELAVPKPPSVFRVLAIGDSCTWGPAMDRYAYPRIMERALNQAIQGEGRVEVVNAGVPGYNYESVLKRSEELLAVDPDLVTIYLGWNRTIFRADPQKWLAAYRSSALYRIFYHLAINRSGTGLEEDFREATFYDPEDPDMKAFETYSFAYDMKDLDRLVRRIRDHREDIPVVLVTIAGLLDRDTEPDPEALEMAYPIASSNNLYAYGILTAAYNEALRSYAGETGLLLVDFERHARASFAHRTAYFLDSVHPSKDGYLALGHYLARQLEPLVLPGGQPGPDSAARSGAGPRQAWR